MTALRAILIDPYTQKVNRITLDLSQGRGLLGELRSVIGCDTLTVHSLGSEVDLWLDDEGLLVDNPSLFTLDGASQAFAGRGVVLGHDPQEGETLPCPERVTPEIIQDMVAFPEPGLMTVEPVIKFYPFED